MAAIMDRLTARHIAVGLLVLAAVIAVLGYRNQHSEGLSWNAIASDYYANVSSELVSIAITVLVIDALNRRREDGRERKRLIREMGSRDNGFALRAVAELEELGCLTDGSLRDVWLMGSNLEAAKLLSADLSGAAFHYANLRGAELSGADLRRAAFWETEMTGVNLRDADLTGANFKYARLAEARVTIEQLRKASALRGTILPNGRIYDGSYQLRGDIEEAQRLGIDTGNRTAMANWYAMSLDEFHRSLSLPGDRPEVTDWGRL